MKFLLCFPIVMTISFAFSQEMHLSSEFFDNNTAVIVPYKWRTPSNAEGESIPYKHRSEDQDCTFSFETYDMNTCEGYTQYLNKLGGHKLLYDWANSVTLKSTTCQLTNIQKLLDDHHENAFDPRISLDYDHTKNCYTITGAVRNDHPTIVAITKQIPQLNRWLAVSNDAYLSAYMFCVNHSKRIMDDINEAQETFNAKDPHNISIHTTLQYNMPIAVAMLEPNGGESCRIKHMITTPQAQLDKMKNIHTQGADEALLHYIIRKIQKEGRIKHVISTNHSYKDEDLIKKGWVEANTEKTEDIPVFEDIPNDTKLPEDNRIDEQPANEIKAPHSIEKPEDRRRKKRPSFCCFRK
ncbi:MAG: hypothetical protein QS748_10065 [Candidatus Endonucleobacter bathymodioli]|uniref:Uncharacterized protein n=1 Tax=Candidatus Endonucleibacter bathymodioli TaxID=539814 RepID=A0AA90SN27_9GAMM|nr:hypothetical protein [Candidatus Endonucleobacter bathymodioli]